MILLLALLLFTPVRVKYNGGGDWYNDPEILPNLMRELKIRVKNIDATEDQVVLSLEDDRIFNYPFLFLTGHGNIRLSSKEIENLRKYLNNGGFLYIDDDYGLDKFIRRELKRVFPRKKLQKVPFSHPIYHVFYDFPKGLPKIHEHYKGPPEGYGIFINGRLTVFYTFNTNISDGWTDRHNDPPQKMEEAFKMGVNIVLYALLY